MTEEEAVEFLKERLEVVSGYPEVKEYSEALEVAIRALEKQIPKKPARLPRDEMGYTYNDYVCPQCGCLIGYEPEVNSLLRRGEKPQLICDCGQKLNWEE